MEKSWNHCLGVVGESGAKPQVFKTFMNFRLDVGTEKATENSLDFDSRGMYANRFQLRV